MRIHGRLIQKQILHDHTFHTFQGVRHMLGIRITLRDILANTI